MPFEDNKKRENEGKSNEKPINGTAVEIPMHPQTFRKMHKNSRFFIWSISCIVVNHSGHLDSIFLADAIFLDSYEIDFC